MWGNLNDGWQRALEELGLDEWHSTDYFRRQSPNEAPKIPAPLLNALGRGTVQEFNCVSYAVDKEAAKKARGEHLGVIPSDSKMLMDLCFLGIGAAKEDQHEPDRIRILFDQGEPFIRHLKASWQEGRRALRSSGENGWPLQVREVEPANSKEHPGLQVADLVSWTIRCRYEYGDRMIDPKIPLMMFSFLWVLQGGFLDEERIRALYIDRSTPTFGHNYSFRDF